jgi:hypothetical protein
MRVKQDDLWLCQDCTFVACNGESGEPVSSFADIERTRQGLEKLGRHLVPDFDSNTADGLREFSSVPCAACDTSLAGYRARFAVLEEDC